MAILVSSPRWQRPKYLHPVGVPAQPLAFALGAGSQMLQPLAIAVIGGILISMLLSLIITPAVYYHFHSKAAVVPTRIEA